MFYFVIKSVIVKFHNKSLKQKQKNIHWFV